MLIPQSDRKKIFEHLFEDGVCIAKKDFNSKSHPDIKGVRNLYVIKALKSLTSKGLVREQYAWRHYYFYLKEEGVPYLREYLGMPEDVLPNTHKQRIEPSRMSYPDKMGGGGAGRGFRSGDDRGSYRTTMADKQADAGPGSMPVRQGFGRGITSVPTPPPQEKQGEDGGNFGSGGDGGEPDVENEEEGDENALNNDLARHLLTHRTEEGSRPSEPHCFSFSREETLPTTRQQDDVIQSTSHTGPTGSGNEENQTEDDDFSQKIY